MPDDVSAEFAALGSKVSYGWGCIPANCTCNTQRWQTALMPRKGIYLVPIKAAIQRACKLSLDCVITITVEIEINAD